MNIVQTHDYDFRRLTPPEEWFESENEEAITIKALYEWAVKNGAEGFEILYSDGASIFDANCFHIDRAHKWLTFE